MTISITGLNLEPAMPYIYHFCYIVLIGIGLFLLHNLINNLGGLKIFSKHDNDLTKQFLDRYPLVDKELLNKDAKEIGLENNQEIQEWVKDYELFKADVSEKLDMILREFKNDG